MDVRVAPDVARRDLGRVSSAVEQRFCKPLVGSSILSPGTNEIKDLAAIPLPDHVARVAINSQAFSRVVIR